MKAFIKIRSLKALLLHVDRETDGRTYRHDEANSRFLHFSYQPWNNKHNVGHNLRWLPNFETCSRKILKLTTKYSL